MTYDDVVTHFGGVVRAANALKISRVTLYRWRNRSIPVDKQAYIQVVTHGKLKANMT